MDVDDTTVQRVERLREVAAGRNTPAREQVHRGAVAVCAPALVHPVTLSPPARPRTILVRAALVRRGPAELFRFCYNVLEAVVAVARARRG